MESPAVYIAEAPGTGLFKIGKAKMPKRRMRQLGGNLKVVALVTGTDDEVTMLEHSLHRHFKHRHMRNEIYCLTRSDIQSINDIKWLDHPNLGGRYTCECHTPWWWADAMISFAKAAES